MKAKIVAANGLDLRLFRTLPDYYRALPGKLSDTLVAMDRAGASRDRAGPGDGRAARDAAGHAGGEYR